LGTDGLLILGETKITYFNDLTKATKTKNLAEATIFVAWEQVDNRRYAIADDYGNLYFLMLILDDAGSVSDWQIDLIGQTSRASTLVYLDAGLIFVGSHQGDSQLVRIGERQIEIAQTFHNVAPILDFTIMDMGNRSGEGQVSEFSSGQARIVAGSGAFNDGSLRSVRSGVGLEDLGALGEMPGISNLFGIKSHASAEYMDTLLVSFLDETRAFSFAEDGDVEEIAEFKGLAFEESTLLARNVPQGRLLQITTKSARLVDLESGMTVSQWVPTNGKTITAGAANNRFALLSMGGQQVLALDIQQDLSVHSQKEFESENQAACIALPESPDDICVIGFWRNSEISIINIDTLEPVFSTSVATESITVPRSVVLTPLFPDKPPTLVIAMADGHIVTYSMDPRTYELKEKKSTILGSQQASLHVLPREDNVCNVFAICEHASLIYGSEGRIVFSAVTADKATSVCSFDAAAYPGAVAISTSENLSLALVDKERTTHVQTLPVGETVRRLAYSPTLKAFGLGTIHRSLENGEEVVRSNFRLADDILFKELNTYELNTDELVESVMWCQLDDGTGALADRFVVGTAYLDDTQDSAVRGRIIIFGVTDERTLTVITEHSVKGAARCLGVAEGKIVAGLIKTVGNPPGSPQGRTDNEARS
jgi:DNA damage-binding protein 1